jgi:hypothetical protein
MYPYTTWQEAFQALPPLTQEDVIEMSERFRHLLPPSYNMHAPQHLLAAYLWHREGHHCPACQYNYGGHAEGMALANATAEVET